MTSTQDAPYPDQDTATLNRDANAYRSMMSGVDTSQFDRHRQSRENLTGAMNGALKQIPSDGHAYLSNAAKECVIGARDLIAGRADTINTTAESVRRTLDNEREWPVARTNDADHKLSDAQEKLSTSGLLFDTLMDGARDALLDQARPQVASGSETLARQDARMLLDGATTVGEAVARIQRYVTDNEDSVAGILADERWLSTYLIGRGWRDSLSHMTPAIQETVKQAARNSSDKARSSAMEWMDALHRYQGAYDATNAMAGTMDPRRKH